MNPSPMRQFSKLLLAAGFVALLFSLASAAIASVDGLEGIGPDNTPVTTRVIDGVTVTISTDSVPADVDGLEDIGPDNTPVTTRLIDGVTVTISTDTGLQMQACTYYDSTARAFNGKDLADNAPLNPGNVSGTRFISTLGANSRFQNVEPITFEFDQPVTSFGLTTLDLLEDEEDPTTTLRLQAFDASDALVDEQVRTGEQGPSGLDLDWSVTGTGIVKVRLTGSITGADIGGYGIDDLVLTIPKGLQMQACTYYDSTARAFNGKDLADNAPLNPGNVSGTRFISTLGANSRFQNVEPITFEFDQPVTSFGLTTLDLLEDEEDPTTTLRLQAFDASDALVDEQVRTGEQGPSGLDLDWSVTGTGIVKVRLTGSIIGTDIGSYGIDDLVLIVPTVTAVPALDRIGLLVLIGALITVGCTIVMRRRLRFS